MAAKKTKKAASETAAAPKKGEGTNIAAKFSDEEIAKIDSLLDTKFGKIARGQFVRTAVLELLASS